MQLCTRKRCRPFEMKFEQSRRFIWTLIMGFASMVLPLSASAAPLFFRSEGKIYVVVGVVVIIFLGIVAFLVRLDRKVRDIEDSNK